jgi:PAS domain S-box-containing protein
MHDRLSDSGGIPPMSHQQASAGYAELAAITGSPDDAIIGLTPQAVVTGWNRAAALLYGYAAEEIIGRGVRVLYPEDRPDGEAEFLRRIDRGEHVRQDGMERRRKDGAVITVSLIALPVIDTTGAVVGIATASWEVSEPEAGIDSERRAVRDAQQFDVKIEDERRAANEAQVRYDARRDGERREALGRSDRLQVQLQQAQRLENLGQLAGGIAHDFNNLLAVILNYVSFVSEELAAATESDWEQRRASARSDLAQVRQAGERAARLTHQLLAFARREVVRPQVLDLDEVITTVEEMLRRTLGEHVELVTSLAGGLWPMLADPGQLEQVLVNLAVNARDAMPAGGTLSIDTSNVTVDADSVAGGSKAKQGRNVRLRVSDTGTGMSAEVIEHVFEPFFTTKEEGAGTGLGLATVYGILTQAEGHIQIYSEPGTGTTFTITLPATAETAVPMPEPAPYQREPKGETVLIVEDEGALREVTKRIFTRNGYQVITAANGPEAFGIARDHAGEIHLLVTDVVMPHMHGKEVAEKMQVIKPGIEVLFMSGYAQPVLASQGRLDPGVALVEKPFSEAELMSKAAQVLNGNFRGFTNVTVDPA